MVCTVECSILYLARSAGSAIAECVMQCALRTGLVRFFRIAKLTGLVCSGGAKHTPKHSTKHKHISKTLIHTPSMQCLVCCLKHAIPMKVLLCKVACVVGNLLPEQVVRSE